MELFNIDGTTKTSFAIGTGTEQIEFRSFDGKFYYRNYGETWKEVAGAGGKVRPWESNSAFEQGEIVSYNGILWTVIVTHTSGLLFDSEAGKMGRIGAYDQITTFDITLANTFSITSSTSNKIFVRGSATAAIPRVILLPSALTFQNGTSFEIQNESNVSAYVQYNDGTPLKEIKSGSLVFFTLTSNETTKGIWSIYDFTIENGLIVVSTKSSNYFASSNEIIPCNTTGGRITITLPPTPSNGDTIGIMDVRGTFAQNPVTIARNNKKIQDLTEDWLLDISNTYLELVYISSRGGWFFKKIPNGSSIATLDIYGTLAPKQAPKIDSFTVTPSLLEIGQSVSSTNPATFLITTIGGTDVITTITIQDVETTNIIANLTVANPSGGAESFVYSPTPIITTSKTYKLSVTDGNLADEQLLRLRILPRHYWGFSDSTTLTSATVQALPSELRESITPFVFGTNVLPTGGYAFVVIPDTFPIPAAIEDVSNAVIYRMSFFTVSSLAITNAFGDTSTYKVIRSNNRTYAGSFTWKLL